MIIENQDIEFESGTVIRWVSSGQYTYAALKTPMGWFTTARVMPGYAQRVPQVATWEELLKILLRPETSTICVATAWGEI